MGLGEALSFVNLYEATDENDAVKRLKAAGASARQGDWVLGEGWDQNDWPGAQYPTRWSLDGELERTPVFASRVDGHAAWVSGEALKRANGNRSVAARNMPRSAKIAMAADLPRITKRPIAARPFDSIVSARSR